MAKKKVKRNIAGLRNQPKVASCIKEAPCDSLSAESDAVADVEDDEGWDAHIRLDSNKPDWEVDEEEEESEGEGDGEDEVIEASEDEWRSDGLHVGLMVLEIEIGDDP
jgi:hypothetical protein